MLLIIFVLFVDVTPKGDCPSDKVFNTEAIKYNDFEDDNTVQINPGGVMFKDPKILHTPVPKNFASYHVNGEDENDDSEFIDKFKKTPILPTPVALQNISKRAQEALAQLYGDVQDEEEDHLKPQKLSFD